MQSLGAQCRQSMQATAGAFVRASESSSEPCPVCGGEDWRVQKTAPRQGRTLAHGQFTARATVLACAQGCCHPDGTKVTRPPASLIGQLLPGSNAGYDVMAFVGLKRFLEHQQRPEIRTALRKEYGVRLSEGEVSHLAKRFVEYLARLHRARAEELQAALISDGGWPMHVDATGEHGRGTLFVVMAGWRRWVLGAFKPATEKAELLVPCMRETMERFGAPCAAMRDLGRAVIPAINELVEELGLNIPVLACHQHLLADVGKDLLEPSHAELRELFRRTKVRRNLRDLVRELGRKLGESIEEARRAVREWQVMTDAGHRIPPRRDGLAVVRSIGQWTLDYPAAATGRDFPFDRPYLDLYSRSLEALRATDAFLRSPPDDAKVVRFLKRLHRHLAPVASEVPFRQITHRLRRRAALFDEMRDVLRLAADPPEGETVQDLEAMREQFDEWVASLKQRRPERGPAQDIRDAIDLILEHVDRHGKNLWGHAIALPKSAGGGVRLVDRTNFLLEGLFFKPLKHGERRRSGHRILTHDLERLPAEAALVYNLGREDYVNIVCGSLDRLHEAFARLDQDERELRKKGAPPAEQNGLGAVLQIATASLSTQDRRVVRTKDMNRRMRTAAASRAPRCQI